MQLEQKIIAEEINKMEYEPLLPVEKKLIIWSLAIGVVSLILLYVISVSFFSAA
jgi:hypothetical protein